MMIDAFSDLTRLRVSLKPGTTVFLVRSATETTSQLGLGQVPGGGRNVLIMRLKGLA